MLPMKASGLFQAAHSACKGLKQQLGRLNDRQDGECVG